MKTFVSAGYFISVREMFNENQLHLVLMMRCRGNRPHHDQAAPGSRSGRRGRRGGDSAAEEMQPQPEGRRLELQDCSPLGSSQRCDNDLLLHSHCC